MEKKYWPSILEKYPNKTSWFNNYSVWPIINWSIDPFGSADGQLALLSRALRHYLCTCLLTMFTTIFGKLNSFFLKYVSKSIIFQHTTFRGIEDIFKETFNCFEMTLVFIPIFFRATSLFLILLYAANYTTKRNKQNFGQRNIGLSWNNLQNIKNLS